MEGKLSVRPGKKILSCIHHFPFPLRSVLKIPRYSNQDRALSWTRLGIKVLKAQPKLYINIIASNFITLHQYHLYSSYVCKILNSTKFYIQANHNLVKQISSLIEIWKEKKKIKEKQIQCAAIQIEISNSNKKTITISMRFVINMKTQKNINIKNQMTKW